MNEAYALENPIKEVIRTHRLLALGRAPLAERLETLRKIAELDSNNTIWQDDVRMIEKARLAQLDDAIRRATQELDLPALTALEAELARQDWLEPPTEAQRATVKTAADELRRSAARSSLAEITQRLLDAYASRMPRWRGGSATAGRRAEEAAIGRKDPLWVKTAPILEWLDQIDLADAGEASYQDLLRDIEDAIKQGGPRAELERLERIVSEMNRKLPPEVDSAIDDCYRRIDRRNRMLVIASASAVTVLALCCLALVFWFQVNGQRRLAIERTIAQIERLLEKGLTKEARRSYDKLLAAYGGVSDSPDLDACFHKIGVAESELEKQSLKFRELLRDAKANPYLTVDSPEIKGLRRLLKTPDDELAFEKLLDRIRDQAQKDLTASESELATLVDRLRPELAELESSSSASPLGTETGEKLRALKDDFAHLKSLAPKAEPNRRRKPSACRCAMTSCRARGSQRSERPRSSDSSRRRSRKTWRTRRSTATCSSATITRRSFPRPSGHATLPRPSRRPTSGRRWWPGTISSRPGEALSS